MNNWQIFGLVWGIAGIIFTVIEHYSYDWDFAGMSKKMIFLNMLHQLIHYSRCIIVWPWYLIEDLLIIASNNSDEDGGPDDDGIPT